MSRLFATTLAALLLAPFAAFAADEADAGARDAGADDGERAAAATRPPLRETSDVEALAIRHLHVVLERKGERIEVAELLTLASEPGTRFVARGDLRLPLPRGAVAPRTEDAGGEQITAVAEADGFRIDDEIGPGGEDLSIGFEIPIDAGRAAFEQRFPIPVRTYQVVSTWTRAGAELRVGGGRRAVREELTNGLGALIAMGRGLDGGALSVELVGVSDGAERFARRAALVLSLLLFAAGAVALLRRRRGGKGSAW